MKRHSASPIHSILNLIENRSLFFQMVKRNIATRYRGSALGILWSLITPLVMLAVYSFVFTFVFNTRFGGGTGGKGEYAVMLFSGLILHQFMAEILTRSPSIILENVNFVKKVVFPLEMLVPSQVLSAMFQLVISYSVLLVGVLITTGGLPGTIIFAPVVILLFALMMCGLGWFLAATGVFLRDISQVMPVLVTIMLFISTVFYPSSSLPEDLRFIIYLNPLSFAVDELRAITMRGEGLNWNGILIYGISSLAIYFSGFCWFQKTRKGFADVI